MNDRQINDLVRMALEVDELESPGPNLRLVRDEDAAPRASGAARWWWSGAGLAAAAGIALAIAFPAIFRPAPIPGGPPIATTDSSAPAAPAAAPEIIRHLPTTLAHTEAPSPALVYPVSASPAPFDPGLVEKCLVMAIYRGPQGAMHCVKVKPHVWSENKCLSDITQQELKCVSVGQSCSSSADHALLVALSGPQKNLPRTENDAARLAACILGTPCDNDSKCYSLSAAQCLPSDVSVKIETLADSR